MSIEEFQGKIEAARLPDGPLVFARSEALIAGLGQAEALRRGAAYAEAGADAVLIHSKEKTPQQGEDATARRRRHTRFSNSAVPGPGRCLWYWCRPPTRSCLLPKLQLSARSV